MAIVLNPIVNPDKLSLINSNFTKIAAAINESLVWRNGNTAGETSFTRDLDMNGYQILNAYVGDYSLSDVVEIANGAAESAAAAAIDAARAEDAADRADVSAVQVADAVALRGDLAASGGAGLVGGMPKPVTWNGFAGGADNTGSSSSDAAFAAADKAAMYIPDGTYKLATEWKPTDDQASIEAAGDVSFTGAKPNFAGLIPFQGGPIWSQKVIKRTYQSDKWAGYGNIFQSAHYATSEIPSYDQGGGNVVALYAGADGKGANSAVWAANLVSYANNASATAMGIELNYGVLVNGGLAYGLVVASAGSYETQAGVQLQANNVNSKMRNGLRFNNRSWGLATDYLIGCSGDTTASPAAMGINFQGFRFPGAEISTSSFLVKATRLNTVSRVSIDGAVSGGTPGIGVDSTDANVNLAISAKGNGQLLFNTNGVEGFRISASGQPDSLFVNQGSGNAILGARGGSPDVSIHLAPKGTGTVRLQSNLSLSSSNAFTCGTSASPWAGGFTQTAYTVTSDADYKSDPLLMTDAILDAAEEVQLVQYQYLDRIEEKGTDGARWHFGAIAQRYVEAFERHGLDAHRFGFICYDEWADVPAVIDEDTGDVITPAIEAGSRYGIRYEEMLVMEAALQRRNYARLLAKYETLAARIDVLESK